MSASFFDDPAFVRNYEVMLLGSMVRDSQMFRMGVTKLNLIIGSGREQYRRRDFVFPVHNVIWECSMRAYLISGCVLPTMDVLNLEIGKEVAVGNVHPFELEPAIKTVRDMFMLVISNDYVRGIFSDYLKYVRVKGVEERKMRGGFLSAEDYMRAYNEALQESTISSVYDKGGFPFVDTTIPETEISRIPTFLKTLDDALGGGAGRGEVVVWVAVSGGGKTIALNQIATTASTRFKTFIGTCELVADRMRRRIYSAATGMDYVEFKSNKKMNPHAAAALARTAAAIHDNLFIRDYVTDRCSIPLLDKDLSEMKSRGWVPDVVIIDYLDKITPPVSRPNHPRLEFKEIVEELVRLAVKHNVALHTATQANQKALKQRIVNLSNLSEAYSKVWAADVVIGVSDSQDDDGKPTTEQWLHTAKNRDGAKVTLKVYRDFAKQRFVDEDNFRKLTMSNHNNSVTKDQVQPAGKV